LEHPFLTLTIAAGHPPVVDSNQQPAQLLAVRSRSSGMLVPCIAVIAAALDADPYGRCAGLAPGVNSNPHPAQPQLVGSHPAGMCVLCCSAEEVGSCS
jgi:hypothetical protein